ncbi:uncharacterized protein KGF55_000897 [Candida pseudojiufengensis]|uniref:uncharacterized protein n=1 Tax=Candida pseudojiufengensis TaxID=497109 RepID=UPI00222403C8|nr:uncharacterized protein KGF55_000897 [Candida pseudojiufengensis]KAI5966587.1 hypothetical protein KGF55_000897 [Candida pseudojiufengensis]
MISSPIAFSDVSSESIHDNEQIFKCKEKPMLFKLDPTMNDIENVKHLIELNGGVVIEGNYEDFIYEISDSNRVSIHCHWIYCCNQEQKLISCESFKNWTNKFTFGINKVELIEFLRNFDFMLDDNNIQDIPDIDSDEDNCIKKLIVENYQICDTALFFKHISKYILDGKYQPSLLWKFYRQSITTLKDSDKVGEGNDFNLIVPSDGYWSTKELYTMAVYLRDYLFCVAQNFLIPIQSVLQKNLEIEKVAFHVSMVVEKRKLSHIEEILNAMLADYTNMNKYIGEVESCRNDTLDGLTNTFKNYLATGNMMYRFY